MGKWWLVALLVLVVGIVLLNGCDRRGDLAPTTLVPQPSTDMPETQNVLGQFGKLQDDFVARAGKNPDQFVEATFSFNRTLRAAELGELLARNALEPITLYHAVGTFKGGFELHGRAIEAASTELVERYTRALQSMEKAQTRPRTAGEDAQAAANLTAELRRARAELRAGGVSYYGVRVQGRAGRIAALKSNTAVRLITPDLGDGSPDPIAPIE